MKSLDDLKGVAAGFIERGEERFWVINGELLLLEYESEGVELENIVATFVDNGRVYAVTKITFRAREKLVPWAADYLGDGLRDYAPSQAAEYGTYYVLDSTDVLVVRLGEECQDMIDVTPWIEEYCPEIVMPPSSKVFYENVHGDYYAIIKHGPPGPGNDEETGHLILPTIR